MTRLGLSCALALLCACSHGQTAKGGLVALPGAQPEALDEKLSARRIALVVGINAFVSPSWHALRFAVDDADAVGDVLEAEAHGNFDRVLRLNAGEGTSLAEIRAALEATAKENTDPRDTVVVYFSTHGTLARDDSGRLDRYLVTTDTRDLALTGTALPVEELTRWFGGLVSRRKVLVLATCHSGDGKSALVGAVAQQAQELKSAFFVRPIESVSQATVTLAASGWGQTAREDAELGHDIYTYYLLEALRGEDRNGDGAVTVSEAHDYARTRTYYRTQGRQTPEARSHVQGVDPIVLSGRALRPGQPEIFSWNPRLEGIQLLVDGTEKGRLPGGAALDAGQHRIALRRGEHVVYEGEVELQPGQRLDLASLDDATPAGIWFAPRFGTQLVLDAPTRDDLLAISPMGGIGIVVPGVLAPQLEIRGELLMGGSRGDTQLRGVGRVDYDQLQLTAGLGAAWRWELGPASLHLGPQLGAFYVRRSVDHPLVGDRDFFNLAPGLALGAAWGFDARWRLALETQAHYLVLRVDGESRDTAFAGFYLGLGRGF